MSYEKPIYQITYCFPLFDFGGGSNASPIIAGPKGLKGRLIDYGVQWVSEAFAGGTTTPQMSIGTAADKDHYGEEFDFGALAVASGGKSIRSTYAYDDLAHIATYILNDGALPADTPVEVTLLAATGSGLTGMAIPFVKIDWGG
jgi:hypothetical protein